MKLTTLPFSTVTLHLCPEGLRLYDEVEKTCINVEADPCTENRHTCDAALRAYFNHRRGTFRRDGNVITHPCPDCKIETFRAGTE